MDFEPTSRRMRLRALQFGVEAAQVQAQTGFELLVSDDVEVLPPPLPEELEIYRNLRDGASVSSESTSEVPLKVGGQR
jgi:glutaconate CoA-transferase subunit B